MAGGTVPVTAPRIPDPAPNEPSTISPFWSGAGVPGSVPAVWGRTAPPLAPAAAEEAAPDREPQAVAAMADARSATTRRARAGRRADIRILPPTLGVRPPTGRAGHVLSARLVTRRAITFTQFVIRP